MLAVSQYITIFYLKDSIDLLVGNYQISQNEGIMLENSPASIEANKRFLAV
jgi:hypothetical protein